jgi:hypothetical protein
MNEATALAEIAGRYQEFGRTKASGRSRLYADVSERIAGDERVLAFLTAFPRAKQQPNLLFGAVQFVGGRLRDAAQFFAVLADRGDEVAAVMRARSTQTNIPARCATLLPALARLPQPLALVEVGASAGLCLYPDRYAYHYVGADFGRRELAFAGNRHPPIPAGGRRVPGSPGRPAFRCAAGPGTPIPDRPVEVLWRAGLDLNPLDVADPDHRAWLHALVWPGEEHLGEQLEQAMAVARAEPAELVAGDLTRDLPALLERAPAGATVVVFHTAVLMYVDEPGRRRFADTVRASGCVWLANEVPDRIPGAGRPPRPFGPGAGARGARPERDHVLMCQDGEPLAWTDGHGGWIDWLAAD